MSPTMLKFASLLLLSLAPPVLSQAVSSSAALTLTPGAPCATSSAYCAGGPIILRCYSATLQPGNCNDNLGEPSLGALCVDTATSTGAGGAATCSAYTPATTTSTASSFVTPSLGASCTGTAAFCAASPGVGPIIIRCEDSTVVAGNCDDNLGEPANGAVCVGSAPTAYCSAYPTASSASAIVTSSSSSRMTSTIIITETALATVTASKATPTPLGPGSPCTSTSAYCAAAAGAGPIIFRCEDSVIVAGNCADNLGEPLYGAVCTGVSGMASCSALPAPSSAVVASSALMSSVVQGATSVLVSASSVAVSIAPYTASVTAYTGAAAPGAVVGPGGPMGWMWYVGGVGAAAVFGVAAVVL